MRDMCEPLAPEDFAEILADESAPLIVGGQAINLWAELYLGRCPELGAFLPFTSRDADIFGTREEAEKLAHKTGWHCRFIHDPNMATVAVLVKPSPVAGPAIVVEVLGEVNGLAPGDLVLDTLVEVAAGRRYRVPAPPVLLKAKLYNLVSLANLDRPQDVRHARMLLCILPLYLMDLAKDHADGRMSAEELAGAIRYVGGVVSASFAGNAARAHRLELADVFPPELERRVSGELAETILQIQAEARREMLR